MTQHAPASPASRTSAAPQTLPEPAPSRSNEEYRWTWPKALEFLHALADCGKVAEAARAVGMTRQSAYRLRERSALVAEGWPLALAAGQARRAARARLRRRRKVTHSATRPDTQGDTLRQGYASAQRKVTLCAEQVDSPPRRTHAFAPKERSAAGFRQDKVTHCGEFFP